MTDEWTGYTISTPDPKDRRAFIQYNASNEIEARALAAELSAGSYAMITNLAGHFATYANGKQMSQ